MKQHATDWCDPQYGFEGEVASWGDGEHYWLCHHKLAEYFPFTYDDTTRVRLVMSKGNSQNALHIGGVEEEQLTLADGRTIWVDQSIGDWAVEGIKKGLHWMRLEEE